MSTIFIIILVLIIIILVIGIVCFFYIRNKVRDFSKKVFDTTDIIEGFKKQEIEYQETPKSLSSLDSVYVPKILKDFPNLNIDEMKEIASNCVRNYYNCLNKKEFIELSYGNNNYNNMVTEKINNIRDKDVTYNNLTIYKTVINSYSNKKGSCIITFQLALSYIDKSNKKVQKRVNVDMIYIYDEVEANCEYGVSLNCQNCGAPIKVLGIKTCPYCGTGVVDYIPKTWKVNNIYEK